MTATGRRPRRHWTGPGAVTWALCLGLVAGACGVPVDSDARVVADEDVPYGLLSATTTTVRAAESQGDETSICLVIDGSLLAVGRDRSGESALSTLTQLVLAGPTEGEASLGLRSALSSERMVTAVLPLGPLVQVQLGSEFAELPADQQLLAVAQITCTLTTQPGIQRVSFSLAGRDIEVPTQDGSLVARPVERSDYAELIAN